MMNLTHCQYWAQVEIQSLYLFQMLIFPYRYLIFTNIIITYCLGPGCSPFFTFLRAIFFCPFSLSLAPTIHPWVSKDGLFKAGLR